jgi:hypothetical protein
MQLGTQRRSRRASRLDKSLNELIFIVAGLTKISPSTEEMGIVQKL